MADELQKIEEKVDKELVSAEGFEHEPSKITHVENLFIISYLTKALQDILIRKARFLQYPLLLIDLPLAAAILIVNVERILYVKVLGYFMAHIQYDVAILRSMVETTMTHSEDEPQDWKERAFDAVRKFFRFLWGLIILAFILPVWPLIWIYNYIVQTLLIAIIYYFLMFWSFSYPGGFLVYFFLLATVTFLVASITVPFIFQLSVYFRAMFSLEKKTWKQVHREAKLAFVRFYQRLYGNYSEAMIHIKARYSDEYKAEGGVYYMLLKFLHYLKDKLWKLKEKKMEAVVEKIQDKTVEFVDDYYQERNAYDVTLRVISVKELKRTVLALTITIAFSVLLVFKGSAGHGLVGPILQSFVDQGVSQKIWLNQNANNGYYEDMVLSYNVLPNFLTYVAMVLDQFFHYFFRAYYFVSPLYLEFLGRYYAGYLNLFLSAIFVR
jgi:hypothetical protein